MLRWSCNSDVTVCFFLTIVRSPYLALSVCWHTENTHYWLLAAAHRCCWGYHSWLPFQGSLFRLLNRCTHTHTHTHTRTRSHMHTLSHSQQCMHTRSSHNVEPDRGVLQVNRCMLLTCISACWAFCFLLIAFNVVFLWSAVRLFVLFLFFFLSARNCFVWHIGIFLFSRKERVAPSVVARMCVSSSS